MPGSLGAPLLVPRNARRRLRRVRALVVAVCTTAGAAFAVPMPDCIQVWGEARSRNAGYDHIVHINNRCDDSAVCDVATDVNPVPIRVTVPPNQEVEVLTFRGSPAREFIPKVDCRLPAKQHR